MQIALSIYSPSELNAGEYYCGDRIEWCLHKAVLLELKYTDSGVKVLSSKPGYLLKYPGRTSSPVWVQTPPVDEWGELLQVFPATDVDAAVCVDW